MFVKYMQGVRSNCWIYWDNFIGADLSYANLHNTSFSNADLYNVDLSYANLRSVNFRYADFRNVDLSYANLHNTSFSNANLHDVDLRYANLRYANLHNANLHNVDLYNADLCYANLRYANLYNVDLNNTDLVVFYGYPWQIFITGKGTIIRIGCDVGSYRYWRDRTNQDILDCHGEKEANWWKKDRKVILGIAKSLQED